MSKSGTKTIGITMGDPRGVGPEVIRKAFASKEIKSQARFVCIGDRKLLKGVPASIIDILYRDAGEGSLKFLQRSIDLIKGGIIDGLVTAPLAKEAVSCFQKGFHGHTEYLAEAFNVKRFDMMFIGPKVRLSLVTRHVPIKDVPALITKKAVFDCIGLMHATLQKQFHVRHPRIAVLGLNPHAGEKGLLGKEDMQRIAPAIDQAKKNKINAYGPFPADTFFIHMDKPGFPSPGERGKGRGHHFDGVVAMYHDQGLAPVKSMYFKELVNFTAGLPFVRTSPVHGTGFDIAGRGIADPSSMVAAINLACQLV